jgi:hypothetical protein
MDALRVAAPDAASAGGWGALSTDLLAAGSPLDTGLTSGPLAAGSSGRPGADPLRDTLTATALPGLPGTVDLAGPGGSPAAGAAGPPATGSAAPATRPGTSRPGAPPRPGPGPYPPAQPHPAAQPYSSAQPYPAAQPYPSPSRPPPQARPAPPPRPAPQPRPAPRSQWPGAGPGGPSRYGTSPPARRTAASDLGGPIALGIDEAAILAEAPAWVSRAVTRAAERAAGAEAKRAGAEARRYGGGPTGSRYGGPPPTSSWQQPADVASPQQRPAGQPTPYQRRQRPRGRRRSARLIWVPILLFILFFNTVSSCIRTQLDGVTRNPTPAPTYQVPTPSR